MRQSHILHSAAARCRRAVFVCGRLLLSATLCYSGLLHLSNPYEFLSSILDYRYLEFGGVAVFIAAVLPALQIVIGIGIAFEPPYVCAILGAIGMLGVFFFAQIGAWLRGLPIDCGCFGSRSHQVGFASVAIVGGLWVVALVCLRIQMGAAGRRWLRAGSSSLF